MPISIHDPRSLGAAIRTIRRQLGLTQDELALAAGTHRRFIVELERGKGTSQLGKTLRVVSTLGARLEVEPPRGIPRPAHRDRAAR